MNSSSDCAQTGSIFIIRVEGPSADLEMVTSVPSLSKTSIGVSVMCGLSSALLDENKDRRGWPMTRLGVSPVDWKKFSSAE